jgi:AraC-like DNA-binding protein
MTALVRAASLGNYTHVAHRHGLDPLRMLREAGLNPAHLADPDLRIRAASVVELLEASARKSGCLTLGLEMAESWRMSDFGAISLLLTHQRTLRDALSMVVRYRHLLNDAVSLEVEESGALVFVREEIVIEASVPPSRQAIELAIGVVFRMFRALLGPEWKPRGVRFVHAAPPKLTVHHRVFGANVRFGAQFNGIVLAAEDLDRPNPSADAAMARHAQRYLDSLPGASMPSIAEEVRRSIHVLLPRGRASIEQVAQALGTQPRTLQRRLEATGDSFASLLNATRRELAVRHLDNPAYSLAQVADLLGYGFASSFTRWFVAEFGRSPSEWRHAHERHAKRPPRGRNVAHG